MLKYNHPRICIIKDIDTCAYTRNAMNMTATNVD